MPALKFASKLSLLACTYLIVSGCSKSFTETDPTTGTIPVSLTTTTTGTCAIIRISQKNRDYNNTDNAFLVTRDTAFLATHLQSYDSLAGRVDFDINITVNGDTVNLSTGEWLLIDKSTKLVTTLFTKSDITDSSSDDKLCLYFYNSQGLLVKKQIFLNGSTEPSFETNYQYDKSLLISCIVTAGTNKIKLIEATLSYDTTKTVKPWLYLFPDFFEGYHYLQSFNFGKKAISPVQSILTRIFDINDGSLIDYWYTTFSGYVISKDGFIIQTTAGGDQQQGLGLLYGITRFDYQCNK